MSKIVRTETDELHYSRILGDPVSHCSQREGLPHLFRGEE